MHAVWSASCGLSEVQGLSNLLQKFGVGRSDPRCQEGQLVEIELV